MAQTLRPLTIGELLDRTFFYYRRHFVLFVGIAALPAVLLLAFQLITVLLTTAESGLLLNYGPNLRDIYRGLARYVNRILRGAKPEDLPVELPRTVELVVNMGTAKALGIKLRPTILLRADRVIE